MLEIECKVKRQAEGKWETSVVDIMEPIDIGAVDPVAEKVLQHNLTIPDLPASSDKDHPDIVISYNLTVKIVPDAIGFSTDGAIIPITIGNIPHKIAFQNFEKEGENLFKLPDNWIKKYPNIPDHGGDKYISYKSK